MSATPIKLWPDLRRFGAKLHLVFDPNAQRRVLRLLVDDVPLFESTAQATPVKAMSPAEKQARGAQVMEALRAAGFKYRGTESVARSPQIDNLQERQDRRVVVYISEDTNLTHAKLSAIIPAITASDYVAADDANIRSEPFAFADGSDYVQQQSQVKGGLYLQWDADSGAFVRATAAPTYYYIKGGTQRQPLTAFASGDAKEFVGAECDTDALRRASDDSIDVTVLQAWTSHEDALSALRAAQRTTAEIAAIVLPHSVPVGAGLSDRSVWLIADARYSKAGVDVVGRTRFGEQVLRAQHLNALVTAWGALGRAHENLAPGDLLERVSVLSAKTLQAVAKTAASVGGTTGSTQWLERQARMSEALDELADGNIYSGEDAQRLSTARDAMWMLSRRAQIIEANDVQPAANSVVQGAMIEAQRRANLIVVLDSAYQGDGPIHSQAGPIGQTLFRSPNELMSTIADPALVPSLITVANEPSRELDSFSSKRRELLDATAALVRDKPRGSYAMVRGEYANNIDKQVFWDVFMARGDGELMPGVSAHGFLGAAQPSIEQILERARQSEFYTTLQQVNAIRATRSNQYHLASLVEQGLAQGKTYKSLDVNRAKPLRNVIVESFDPRKGTALLSCDYPARRRGEAAQRQSYEIAGTDLAQALGVEPGLKPLHQITRFDYLKNQARVAVELLGQSVGEVETTTYTHALPGGSPAVVQGRMHQQRGKYAVGDEVATAFGQARINAIEPSNTRPIDALELFELAKQLHERAVGQALVKGDAVDAKVLNEYPQWKSPAVSKGGFEAAPTTEVSEPVRKRIDDVGQKIGGARKDFGKRALAVDDLADMTDVERTELVNKTNIWPKLDYVAMRESGLDAYTAYRIKLLKDAIEVRCQRASDSEMYIRGVETVREHMAAVRTRQEFGAALEVISRRLREIDPSTEKYLWTSSAPIYRALGQKAVYAVNGYDSKVNHHRLARNATSDGLLWDKLITPEGEKTQRPLKSREDQERYRPERPHLDRLERIGTDWRHGRDVSGEELLETFGFRGIEYGNWLPQDERQSVLNHAYDSFCDLAQALGVDNKSLSLGGQLAVAFGARGLGKASAHYEPGRNVINMTRIRGAGAAAHEWGHAFDRWASLQVGSGALFFSNHVMDGRRVTVAGGQLPPEFQALSDALNKVRARPLSVAALRERTLAKAATRLDQAMKNITGFSTLSHYTRFDSQLPPSHRESYVSAVNELFNRACDVITISKIGEDATSALKAFDELRLGDSIATIYRLNSGNDRSFLAGNTSHAIQSWIAEARNAIRDVGRANLLRDKGFEYVPLTRDVDPKGQYETQMEKSAYLLNAERLDQKRKTPYYTEPTEMFARAFEAYVFDRLATNARRCDYLVQGVEQDRYSDHVRYAGNPYPVGNERTVINTGFDKAFAALESRLGNGRSADPGYDMAVNF